MCVGAVVRSPRKPAKFSRTYGACGDSPFAWKPGRTMGASTTRSSALRSVGRARAPQRQRSTARAASRTVLLVTVVRHTGLARDREVVWLALARSPEGGYPVPRRGTLRVATVIHPRAAMSSLAG